MTDTLTLELVLTTGDRIIGDLADAETNRHQAGLEGTIHWREEPSDDHDRAMQTLIFAMAAHLERDGEFSMYDRDHRYWIIRTSVIAAVSITDPGGTYRAPVGFVSRNLE